MNPLRSTETRLAKLTLVALGVFAPLETVATWEMLGGLRGLIHPAYIVTFTGMVLMLVGAWHSLRARPRPAPALMGCAHAWLAAYGWRSVFWRADAVSQGLELTYGRLELWATIAAGVFILGCLITSLWLTSRLEPAAGEARGTRKVETGLAMLTLVALLVLVPIETAASWQMAGAAELLGPRFLHKVFGMVLLFVGARASLRVRPRRAPALMCAAHAWWAATGWSATAGRLHALSRGHELHYGAPELWAVTAATVLALAALAVSFVLTYRLAVDTRPRPARHAPVGPTCTPRDGARRSG